MLLGIHLYLFILLIQPSGASKSFLKELSFFATNSDVSILISLQPDVVEL